MRISPPLAITGIIAASFAWMAGQYNGSRIKRPMKTVVYYSESPVYWLCEDGSREPVVRDQPNHCPQTLAGKTTP